MVSVEMLHRLLICDAESGNLWWRERTPDLFQAAAYGAERKCAAWNGRFAMQPALTALEANGYLHGFILSRKFKAHRVIVAMHTGEWPQHQVDHINGIRTDNRVTNLRCVTDAENKRNQKRRSDNTSGTTGVSYAAKSRKWDARLTVGGKVVLLGAFADKADAVAARDAAAAIYGFHPNHGRA